MVLAAFFFTLMNLAVRQINHFPVFNLVFFRSLGSMCCGLIFLKAKHISILGNHKKLLILRACLGVAAMSLFFKAIQLMPLSSATTLRYLSPFFAAAFAIFFLKEKMNPIQWLFFLSAFIGVMILKGFDTRISLFGLCIVVSSAALSGLVYVTIRQLSKTEHPVVIVNYFMCAGTLLGGLMCCFNWVNPTAFEWLLIAGMGIVGFVAQVCMTKALHLAEANLITPFKYSEVLFTLIAGYFIFGEYQTLISLFAIGLIVASLIANLWAKNYTKTR